MDYFNIGKIIGAFGIKGEIKIYPSTDDIRRFDLLDELILELNGSIIKKKITKIRYHKGLVLASLDGIDDIDAVLRLKSATVLIERENALPLSNDEYYIADLIGLNVHTTSGEILGTLDDCIKTGANDVYVVDKSGKNILIPAIKQCIKKVDISNKIMEVELLEGLL